MTELSDGQIEMWTINTPDGQLFPWLQRVDHLDRVPQAPCFFLICLPDGFPSGYSGGTEVYRDDCYVVFEFTDPSAFFAPAEDADASS